jgi:serine O-acetyltransferase
LIDHASTQTQRIDEIVAALERLGARVEALNAVDGAALVDLKRLCTSMDGKATEEQTAATAGR